MDISEDQQRAAFLERFPIDRILNELSVDLGTPLRAGAWRPRNIGGLCIDIYLGDEKVECFIDQENVEDYVEDTSAEGDRDMEGQIRKDLRSQLRDKDPWAKARRSLEGAVGVAYQQLQGNSALTPVLRFTGWKDDYEGWPRHLLELTLNGVPHGLVFSIEHLQDAFATAAAQNRERRDWVKPFVQRLIDADERIVRTYEEPERP